MSEVKTAAASLGSRVAVTQVGTVSGSVAEATKQPALRMALLGWFAAASLLLAAIGVYGLVSQSVAERMREIGIRLALGAGTNDSDSACRCRRSDRITRRLRGGPRDGEHPAGAGVRRSRHRRRVICLAGMAMLMVTAIAAFVPAPRATRIDPAQVLRSD
jgi:ABC-type antimicrobial peptide transport system permease subunit